MPPRMTHEVAASRLLELGYRALEEYPGCGGKWSAEHLGCGREVTLTWNRARLRDLPGCPCREAEIAANHAAAGQRRRAANEQGGRPAHEGGRLGAAGTLPGVAQPLALQMS